MNGHYFFITHDLKYPLFQGSCAFTLHKDILAEIVCLFYYSNIFYYSNMFYYSSIAIYATYGYVTDGCLSMWYHKEMSNALKILAKF